MVWKEEPDWKLTDRKTEKRKLWRDILSGAGCSKKAKMLKERKK